MNLFSERKIDKIFYNIMVLIFVLLVVRIIVSNGSAMREIFQHSDLVDSGMDFFNSIICTKDAEPYKVFKTLYPPLANMFFYFCYLCIPNELSSLWNVDWNNFYLLRTTNLDLRIWQAPLMLFILYVQIITIAAFIIFKSSVYSKSSLFSISLLFTSGMLFALERGNIIIVSMLILLYFVLIKDNKSMWKRECSLVALGVTSGLKIYPIIFSIILLKEKRYLDFLKSIVYFLFFLFVPFFFFNGLADIKIWIDVAFNVSTRNDMALGTNYLGFIQVVKTVIMSKYISKDIFLLISLDDILKVSRYFILLFFVLSFVKILFEKKTWKIYLILSLIIAFTQQHSPIYNTIFFIIPFIFFINAERNLNKNNFLYFIFFLLILIPLPSFGHLKIAHIIKFLDLFVIVIYVLIDTIYDLYKTIEEKYLLCIRKES